MKISFFEEFPTKNNLEKLKLITWPTKIYLAAKSVAEFNRLKKQINQKFKPKNQQIELIYWPILEIKEGYWISPFTKRSALKRIFNELNLLSELKNKKTSIPVMLDLELPTTKNPLLYLTQFFNFSLNKILIKRFIHQYSGDVYLAEYYPEGKKKELFLKLMGLHYKTNQSKTNHVKIIKMLYHSMHHFNQEFIVKELMKGKQEFGKNYLLAYGTIAQGIEKSEPKLSLSQLRTDLEIAKSLDIEEIIIFRLSGLNNNYLNVIKKYV